MRVVTKTLGSIPVSGPEGGSYPNASYVIEDTAARKLLALIFEAVLLEKAIHNGKVALRFPTPGAKQPSVP